MPTTPSSTPSSSAKAYRDYFRIHHGLLAKDVLAHMNKNGLSALIVRGNGIMQYMNTKRASRERRNWIIADLKNSFPGIMHLRTEKGLGDVFFSLLPIPDDKQDEGRVLWLIRLMIAAEKIDVIAEIPSDIAGIQPDQPVDSSTKRAS